MFRVVKVNWFRPHQINIIQQAACILFISCNASMAERCNVRVKFWWLIQWALLYRYSGKTAATGMMTFYQCLDSDSKIRLVDPNNMNILRIIHVHSGPLRYHHSDSKQCRPRSGPHLACMDFTRARCGLDLGQHYVAVWAVARVNMSVNIFHIPKKPCFFLKPFGRNHCVSTFESQLL